MTNEEIINAISVLRTVLKAAKLAHEPAEAMIKSLQKNPVYPESEIERAFCAGYVSNLKSMADFEGNAILKKYEAFKAAGFIRLC